MEGLGPSAAIIDAKEQRQHARTLQLAGLKPEGFVAFRQARIGVVGAGGLASGFLPLAAAMGARHIRLIDDDAVSYSNLPRQLLYNPYDVGQSKAAIAAKVVRGYAPEASIEAIQARLSEEDVEAFVEGLNIVVDCSDNFATRYLLDRVCQYRNLPLLYGAVGEAVGQITLLHGKAHVSLADIFGPQPESMPPPAVFPPAVHMVGTLMASEAFKWASGYGATLDGVLLQIDLRTNEQIRLSIK